jgi:hypothetical protein
MKQTNYNELRNLLLVVSFNQPTGQNGQEIQPVVIEARCESITTEGAVLNVKNEVKIGDVVQTPLTHEELFKTVYGISPVLAKALEGVLFEGIAQDVSKVDVKDVKPVAVADIKP